MELSWNHDYNYCISYMEKLSRLMRHNVLGYSIIEFGIRFSISIYK